MTADFSGNISPPFAAKADSERTGNHPDEALTHVDYSSVMKVTGVLGRSPLIHSAYLLG